MHHYSWLCCVHCVDRSYFFSISPRFSLRLLQQQIQVVCVLSVYLIQTSRMRIVKYVILAIVLNAIITMSALSTQSPLRMCDSFSCDITIQLFNATYIITIPTTYAQGYSYLTYCYRKRPFVNSDGGQCDLSGYDAKYSCASIDSGVNFTEFTGSASLQSNNDSTTMDVSKYKKAAKYITITLDIDTNSIYQIVVGTNNDLSADTGAKSAYFQTFKKPNILQYSGNLLLPRYFVCYTYYFQQDFNFNIIFYGGYVRDGFDTMYIGFLSFLSDDGTTVKTDGLLNIWGGLGLSTSHASRDMIGFSSGLGYVYDLYSLYAGPPYNDTGSNINGTMDFTRLLSTNQQSTITYFIGISGYRKYDTKDSISDEIIRKKMNYQFCYAVGYSSTSTSIEPTGKVQHSFIDCWIPNIVVWQRKVEIGLLMLFMVGLIWS